MKSNLSNYIKNKIKQMKQFLFNLLEYSSTAHPGGSVVKNLPADAGHMGPWPGKIPRAVK